jgi:hypothetical protein
MVPVAGERLFEYVQQGFSGAGAMAALPQFVDDFVLPRDVKFAFSDMAFDNLQYCLAGRLATHPYIRDRLCKGGWIS